MAPERKFGLEIARSFTYPYEAELAKTLLHSRGIDASILDENQIRMRWHLSGALGGVKVAVHPDNLEEARRLLVSDFSTDLENLPESALEPDPCELCPSCGSAVVVPVDSLTRPSIRTFMSFLILWIGGILYPIRRIDEMRTCTRCGHEWRTQASR